MRRAVKKQAIVSAELIGGSAAIALVLYLVLKYSHRQGGGADLWTGLGFPYGPTGNLTGFGGPPIVSITGLSILPGQYLKDMAGNILTDMNGQPLLDMGNQGGLNVGGPGVNNAQLSENPMLPKSAWPSKPQFG